MGGDESTSSFSCFAHLACIRFSCFEVNFKLKSCFSCGDGRVQELQPLRSYESVHEARVDDDARGAAFTIF